MDSTKSKNGRARKPHAVYEGLTFWVASSVQYRSRQGSAQIWKIFQPTSIVIQQNSASQRETSYLYAVDLPAKIRAVEDVFETLDQEIAAFQSWSSLGCKVGCGKCCFKPDIEATILEFLPFAHYLYTQDQAFEWLEKIKTADSTRCTILNPLQGGIGMCSQYRHRGLICRLFGFSARTNKYGKKELVTCQIIKEENATPFNNAVEKIEAGAAIPVMNQHYMRLHAIDFELTREFFPINEAIKRAIEVILHYHAYRS